MYANKIIGVQNYINFNQFDNKLFIKQIFLSLWSSPFDNKFIGTGYRLFKEIQKKEKPNFIGSIGLNDKTLKFHKWQKFKVGHMDHYVTLSPFNKKFFIAQIPKKLEIKKINNSNKIFFRDVNKINIFKFKFDSLFKYQIPQKSKRYLVNRYLKHPFYNYEIKAGFKNNKITGIYVLRKIKHNNSHSIKIVDFIGENKNFKNIKYLLLKIFQSEKIEFASLYVHGIPKNILDKSNFILASKYSGLIIPQYFEPFLKKNITINFAYKSYTKGNVRIFNADGDQDRPNL